MPNLHPIFVHFTIALFTMAVIFDILGFFLRKESLNAVGWWNLLGATIFAVLSVSTGLFAGSSLPHSDEIHRIMEIHETLGIIVLGFIVVLFIWRSFYGSSLPTKLTGVFLLTGAIGVGLLITGSYYGGEMVYRHGMGVAPIMEQMALQHDHSGHPHGQSEPAKGNLEPAALYACPMHPEVISDKPGLCPRCGMALVEIETNFADTIATDSEKQIHIHKDGSSHTH